MNIPQRLILKVLVLVALPSVSVMAATWTPLTGANSWDVNSNWSTPATFPNAVGATANISADFSGAQTINLNQIVTVGSLTFNDSGASADSAVTIATGTSGSLTFQVASGNATVTNSSTGVSNIISAPMTIASATTFNTGNATSTGITLSGNLSGSANITKTGNNSTLTLSGPDNSAFAGNWILSGGSSTSILSISSDGQLGGVSGSGTNGISLTTNNAIVFTATMTLNANRSIAMSSGTGIYLTPNSGVAATIAGNITGAGGINVKGGSGTAITILAGANAYTGPTGITSGVLRAGSTTAFGNNSAMTITNASTPKLDLNGFSNSIGSLTGGGPAGGNVTLGSGTLTTGGDNTSPAAYAGIISGTGGFTKVGTGTQTLSGVNTYTGNTTISAGTLALGASGAIHVNSAITVASGATFDTTAQSYTFSTAKTTTIGVGATTAGLINAAVVTFSSANLAFDFGSVSTLLGSYNVLTNTGHTGDFAGVIATGTSISGTFLSAGSGNWTLASGGYDLTFSESLGTLTAAAAIPEPSTYATIIGALVFASVGIRRRCRCIG